jgi:meso-butanediol dehydrogenase / (S,S)-butanediol dehydrogenase / diacetyl reductase
MTGRLEGKVALVTGTGGRQGRVIAKLFAAEGATVVGCDIDGGAAEATVAAVREAGWEMDSTHPVDLGDGAAAKAWVDGGVERHGGFDILYNNASTPKLGPLATTTWESWQFTMRNELDLIYHVTHAAWPHLVARGGGAILNTGSVAGMIGDLNGFAHAATKGGVIALTRQLAAEGAPHNIRVNTISPGLVVQEGPVPVVQMGSELMQRMIDRQLIPRPGVPLDVAYCALYLVSDESTWVTGANFVVDGGLTAT